MDTGQVIQVVQGRLRSIRRPREGESGADAGSRDHRLDSARPPASTRSAAVRGVSPTWRDGVCYAGPGPSSGSGSAQRTRQRVLWRADVSSGPETGFVFRGAVGPWYSETSDAFHLDQDQGGEADGDDRPRVQGQSRRGAEELFIHGKTNFEAKEWAGFASAVPQSDEAGGDSPNSGDNADVKVFRYGCQRRAAGHGSLVTSETSGLPVDARIHYPRLRTLSRPRGAKFADRRKSGRVLRPTSRPFLAGSDGVDEAEFQRRRPSPTGCRSRCASLIWSARS